MPCLALLSGEGDREYCDRRNLGFPFDGLRDGDLCLVYIRGLGLLRVSLCLISNGPPLGLLPPLKGDLLRLSGDLEKPLIRPLNLDSSKRFRLASSLIFRFSLKNSWIFSLVIPFF